MANDDSLRTASTGGTPPGPAAPARDVSGIDVSTSDVSAGDVSGDAVTTGATSVGAMPTDDADVATDEADVANYGGDEAGPTDDDVMDALGNVIDPELGLDFVELGLVYGVTVEGGHVHVTFTLTTPGCPIGPSVSEQIEEFVSELDGVTEVTSEMVFTPAWTPERMSEDAKFALGF